MFHPAGHEDLVKVFIAGAAFKSGSIVKVVGLNRTVLVIRQSSGRGTISASGWSVTLPALHFLKHGLPGFEPIRSDLWLRRNFNRRSGLFRDEARREVLHVRHQVRSLLRRKWVPRHIGNCSLAAP